MASISKINVEMPAGEGGETSIEQYDIAALKLVRPADRNPWDVGDQNTPVYFHDGIPMVCTGGGGGGGGGSDVSITPQYSGGILIANYQIDGVDGEIRAPRTDFVYKRSVLWSGNLSDVGDSNINNPFSSTFGNYSFLLVHYAPSNNLTEERTMMLDTQAFISLNNAVFSCHYLSDVFIKCQFVNQSVFRVIESRSLPLDNEQEPTLLKCVITKIEGFQFGVSGEDLNQGLTVRKVLWSGLVDEIDEGGELGSSIESYNYIYIHYYESDNQYDERIIILDTEAILRGLKQTPSQAIFNCYFNDSLYIKGQFLTTTSFKAIELEAEAEPYRNCVINKIEGICMGSVNDSGGGGDISTCMIKGVDYVTAGNAEGYYIGLGATVEGGENIATENYAHAEGYMTSAEALNAHTEGYCTRVFDTHHYQYSGGHAEGYYTSTDKGHAEGYSTIASDYTGHAEGYNTCAAGGHAEGNRTTALVMGGYDNTPMPGHAEGHKTYATGYAHAEGSFSTAISYNTDYSNYLTAAHVEGTLTYAFYGNVHAEGYGSTANANDNFYSAHAEGSYTYACEKCTHTEGFKTTANNFASHAQGHYNALMTTGGSSSNRDGTAFVIGNGTDKYSLSNAFSVMFDGTVSSLNTQNNPGQDYAENFEWSDSNINEEDRVGYFVTFDEDDKIRIANSNDDYILGIVSGSPSILGNSDCDIWNQMYLRDNFNRFLEEDAPLYKMNPETGEEESVLDDEGNQVYQGKRFVLNPDYDDSQEYIRRSERPEWAPVGMLGVLSVRDDGTCQVNKYCKVNDNGIATYQATYNKNENYYRVIERVAENVVKVVFR